MQHPIRSWRAALVGAVAVGMTFSLTGIGLAGTSPGDHGAGARQQAQNSYLRTHSTSQATTPTHTPDDGDLADQFAQYDAERTAPAGVVSGPALVSAQQQAAALPQVGSRWQEFTNEPYNAQPANYTDPFWSNVGAGFSLVGGRTTALAAAPDGTWFAGTADGGVLLVGLWRWRSAESPAVETRQPARYRGRSQPGGAPGRSHRDGPVPDRRCAWWAF